MTCVIACSKLWRPNLASRVQQASGEEVHLVTTKDEFNVEYLNRIAPTWIFLPHWSHRIPQEIYTRWNCVLFHMTDLPFGRGGSPLQNLIVRGFKETKISAFLCSEVVDSGPIYLKAPLSLHGSAQEIYLRATDTIEAMILQILGENITPKPQMGEEVQFARRKPEDSNVIDLDSLEKLYDWIRMVDAEDYPKAFVEIGHFRFEFSKARLRGTEIVADVSIRERGHGI